MEKRTPRSGDSIGRHPWTVVSTAAEYTFLSDVHRDIDQDDHLLGNKTSTAGDSLEIT